MNNPSISVKSNLKKKAINASFWAFSFRIINKFISFIRKIILARLLSPNDFGILGICFLVISILESFTETGFKKTLIQKRNISEDELNSVWTILLIRGLLLYVILFISAPMIEIFFNEKNITNLIRIVGFVLVFTSCTNIGIIFFQKEMDFKKEFYFQLSGVASGAIIGIALAIVLRNIWALVFAVLINKTVMFIMSYLLSPYKPKISFKVKEIIGLSNFAKWLFGLNIIYFLSIHGDDIFVGKVLGTLSLGLYQMAFQIANFVTTEITKVVGKVAFSAFSIAQEDLDKVRKGYILLLKIISNIGFPIVIGLLVLGSDFIIIVLGEKWIGINIPLRILALAGLLRSITDSSYIIAIGKPNVVFKIELIRVLVLIILIYPLTVNYGLNGTAITVLISLIIKSILFFYNNVKILNIRMRNIFKILIEPLSGSFLMAILIIYTKKYFFNDIIFFDFFFNVILGIIFYAFYSILLWRYFRSGPIYLWKNLFSIQKV